MRPGAQAQNLTTMYQRWPFLPLNTLTDEQKSIWWDSCFSMLPAVESFLATESSAALLTMPGNGKSVALAALRRHQVNNCLLVSYPLENWPGGPHPWLPGRSHVSQIMAAAAANLVDIASAQPDRFAHLNYLQQEFLGWLINKHIGRRALARLSLHLAQRSSQSIITTPLDNDLYPSDTNERDVWGQISELVELAQALGFQRVIVFAEVDHFRLIKYAADLKALFSRSSFLDHPSWALKLALPYSPELQAQLAGGSGGRIHIHRLRVEMNIIQEIVERHLRVATNNRLNHVAALATHDVINRAAEEINDLYGEPSIAGWLGWIEALLMLWSSSGASAPINDVDQVLSAFYSRHIPLRLMEGQNGVWRGPQFKPLEGQLLVIMRKLFALNGESAPDSLIQLAGGGENLNTIISRLRRVIEPIPQQSIYIHNRRDLGYWLENFLT